MPIDFMDVMKSKVNHALYSDESMDFTRAYDNMMHLPLSYYIPWDIVCKINKMVTSLKYADKLSYKKKEIVNMLYPYGFRKFASGTNRITLSHVEDHSFLIKVALDNVGMRNNPDELVNSNLLKPFMPKVFDVTPCGTLALVERVLPITCLEEANSIASDIFDLIIYHVIGKYVAADIGTKYYMNWGVRYGFGPVILDLTDLFELDGKKLYCNWQLPDGSRCGGEIDYDIGFNNLICNKCHHIYEARQLAKQINNNEGVITVRGGNSMAIRLMVDGKEVARSNNVSESILTRATRRRRPLINKEGRERPTFSGRLVIGDNTATSVTSIERNTTSPKCNVRLVTESIEPAIPVKEEPVVSDETTVDTNETIKTEVTDNSTLPVEEVKKVMDECLEVNASEQGPTNTEILEDNEIKDRFDNTEDLKENIESITPDDPVSDKITDAMAEVMTEEKVSDEEVKEAVNEVFSESENKEETDVFVGDIDSFSTDTIKWMNIHNTTIDKLKDLYNRDRNPYNANSISDKERILINSFNSFVGKYPEFEHISPAETLDMIINADNEYDSVVEESTQVSNTFITDALFKQIVSWLNGHNMTMDQMIDLYDREKSKDEYEILAKFESMMSPFMLNTTAYECLCAARRINNNDNSSDEEETFETYGTPDEEETSTEPNPEEATNNEDSDDSEIDAEAAAHYRKMINGGEE